MNMPIFSYSAAERGGKIVKGEKEAENDKILASQLKSQGLFLLEANEKKAGGLGGLNFNVNVQELISWIKPISLVDKMFFARNLAVMVSAGLSLTRALDALAEQTSNPKFRKIISEVNAQVTKGKSFADSLKLYDKVFGTLFTNMVEVGETTGKLSLVLKLLASQMKKDYNIRKRVKGAMLYPAIILIALLGIGALMMIYVVPTLTSTLKELNVTLPFTTQIIIKISDLLVNYSLLVFLALALMVFGFWRILKTRRGKEVFDRSVIRAPVFGSLVKKFNTARFCRALAYLITAGVPIVRALEITSSVLGSTLFQHAAREASKEIQKGKQLNAILAVYPKIFPSVIIQMVQVGEETGKLSSMLLRLAIFFEEDVTETTKNLSTIIEPILMIVIGAAVGFFAISMLQPIYSSLGNI